MSWEEPTGEPVGEAARNSGVLGLEISRRRFVVVLGGGVAAIAVAGGYGFAAKDWSPANSSLWTVRIVRARKGARLTADALTANDTSGHADGHSDSHSDGHSDGGSTSATLFPQPANLTWGDAVVLELELLNTAAVPMLFSPGQLRLKLADGLTITPQDASRSPEAIAAGAVERLWVSYLAPSDATDFFVEFTDPLLDARLALDVPGLGGTKAQS